MRICANAQNNNSQTGIFNTAISDYKMIYCTRKILKAKYQNTRN